jgi:hypothetical protein
MHVMSYYYDKKLSQIYFPIKVIALAYLYGNHSFVMISSRSNTPVVLPKSALGSLANLTRFTDSRVIFDLEVKLSEFVRS